jgi:hypothetical protein
MRREAEIMLMKENQTRGTQGRNIMPRRARPGGAAIGILLGAGAMALLSLAVLNAISVIPGRYAVPGTVVLSLALLLGLYASLRRREHALAQGEQQAQALARAADRAKQVAEAEFQARTRQEEAAKHLRQVVQECTAFLERASDGDYSPLTVTVIGTVEGDEELVSDLQAMVDSLNSFATATAVGVQGARSAPVGRLPEGWSGPARADRCLGLRYRDGVVETAHDAWLESMGAAIQERYAVTSSGELALPISWKGSTIGVIGLCRQRDEGWREEEIVFAQTVVDQLSQTLEHLSLLDQAQQHAVHDKLTRRISERLQGAADIEALLQTALREAAGAVGASRAFVQWVPIPDPAGDGTP